MKRLFLIAALALGALSLSTYAATCNPVSVTYLKSTDSGLGEITTDNSNVWTWGTYSSNGFAKASKSGGVEGNIFTPTLDLSGADKVTIAFTHTHKYVDTPSERFTLWVTADYKGSYASSTWHQITISQYDEANNFKWVNASMDVPVAYVGDKTVFCLKYQSTSSNYGTWEVRDLRITSTCDGVSVSPVALPNVGEGRLKVCGQNLLNYYFNANTGRGNYTPEEFATKTRKITDAMLWVDADVYGFCELEAKDIILKQLVDSLNKLTKSTTYAYVADEIDVDWDSYDNNLKSGFVYRKDKVKTVGNSTSVYYSGYYKNTMRVQTFEELSSGERFTLSMNHFKSKAGSAEDQGNSQRVSNATTLRDNIVAQALDKDILIIGDLNCEVGEEPLTILTDAGYEEQLLKYDPSAYSHCYNGGELIDHVYANSSMAEQITGAGMYHISTGCGADASANYNHRYSDHDPYVVGINLVGAQTSECEEIQASYLPTGAADWGDMRAVSNSGQYYWRYQSSYGATCQDKGGEDWLITPSYDLSQAASVTLKFDHALNYANDMTTQQTLWVTQDYVSVGESSWTQLTIPKYPSGSSWTFVSTEVNVPLNTVGSNTAFAFKYDVPADAAKSPTWEIKNLQVIATCVKTAVESIEGKRSAVRKIVDNGGLYILMPDGTRYSVIGTKVQ